MSNYLISNQSEIRISCFLTILVVQLLWELIAPRRMLVVSKSYRWKNNLSLVFFNSVALNIIIPISATSVALKVANHGFGLINYWHLSAWWVIVLSIMLLDFAIYLQHIIFHTIPLLWKIHQVHHADLDIDVTTGVRFHTLEIILSMLIKFAVIILLGVPAIAVVIFEIILNITAMFNHSNIKLPVKIDRLLRYCLVTPDMHRVHHSVLLKETNSNFGFNVPWWDYLFATYQAQPKLGHLKMIIGLNYLQNSKATQSFYRMLIMPFVI